MAYRANRPPLRSKTFEEFGKRLAKGDELSYEEVCDYDEKISAEIAEAEIAEEEAERLRDPADRDHWLAHDMRIGDCLSCVIVTNVPLSCQEKPYDSEAELKVAMNVALSKKFHKEDGTSSMNAALSESFPKEDDFVKMIIVDSPEALFVMKTQEYARAAKGLGSIPFKGVNLNVRTGSYPVWDYSTDEFDEFN